MIPESLKLALDAYAIACRTGLEEQGARARVEREIETHQKVDGSMGAIGAMGLGYMVNDLMHKLAASRPAAPKTTKGRKSR